jgi:hypothetical protein
MSRSRHGEHRMQCYGFSMDLAGRANVGDLLAPVLLEAISVLLVSDGEIREKLTLLLVRLARHVLHFFWNLVTPSARFLSK